MHKMPVPNREALLSVSLLLLSLATLSACKSSENQAIAVAANPASPANPANPPVANVHTMIAVIDQPFLLSAADLRLNSEQQIVQIKGQPNWLIFDPTAEELRGSPANENIGIYDNITLETTDSLGRILSHHLTIEVAAISGNWAEFSWSAPAERTDGSSLTNLAGFRIYAGRHQSELTEWATIPNPTVDRYTIENLGSGHWWFALSAYDSGGIESEKSAAVSRQYD